MADDLCSLDYVISNLASQIDSPPKNKKKKKKKKAKQAESSDAPIFRPVLKELNGRVSTPEFQTLAMDEDLLNALKDLDLSDNAGSDDNLSDVLADLDPSPITVKKCPTKKKLTKTRKSRKNIPRPQLGSTSTPNSEDFPHKDSVLLSPATPASSIGNDSGAQGSMDLFSSISDIPKRNADSGLVDSSLELGKQGKCLSLELPDLNLSSLLKPPTPGLSSTRRSAQDESYDLNIDMSRISKFSHNTDSTSAPITPLEDSEVFKRLGKIEDTEILEHSSELQPKENDQNYSSDEKTNVPKLPRTVGLDSDDDSSANVLNERCVQVRISSTDSESSGKDNRTKIFKNDDENEISQNQNDLSLMTLDESVGPKVERISMSPVRRQDTPDNPLNPHKLSFSVTPAPVGRGRHRRVSSSDDDDDVFERFLAETKKQDSSDAEGSDMEGKDAGDLDDFIVSDSEVVCISSGEEDDGSDASDAPTNPYMTPPEFPGSRNKRVSGDESDDDDFLPDLDRPSAKQRTVPFSVDDSDEEELPDLDPPSAEPSPPSSVYKTAKPPRVKSRVKFRAGLDFSSSGSDDETIDLPELDPPRTGKPPRAKSKVKLNSGPAFGSGDEAEIMTITDDDDDDFKPTKPSQPTFRTPRPPPVRSNSLTTTVATPDAPLPSVRRNLGGKTVSSIQMGKVSHGHHDFLTSLGKEVAPERIHPQALKYIRNFKHTKDELSQKLFLMYDNKLFDCELRNVVTVKWNNRLTKTAGYCAYTRDKVTRQPATARIDLSVKVCDSAERVRDTLLHEMCHAACWVIDKRRDGHGSFWKRWANLANRTYPTLPLITRCHDYYIETKFVYRCEKCSYSIGRHSKSLDMAKKVCGRCKGDFVLHVRQKDGQLVKASTQAKTPLRGFALYVKEFYSETKSRSESKSHRDVMKLLSAQFNEKNRISATASKT